MNGGTGTSPLVPTCDQDASLGYLGRESVHALAVRESMREAMRATVPDRIDPERAARSPVAAGADVAEGDTAQPVAAEHVVSVSESDAAYRYSVERERQARLIRWQRQPHVDPRERRA